MQRDIQFDLRGVEFSYPGSERAVLRGVDMKINSGEWVALLGANGSGKSTLLKILNALLLPVQGIYFYNWRECAAVFQNPDDQLVAVTVEEDVAFAAENSALDVSEIDLRVTEALTKTGLIDKRYMLTSSLSGGEKQSMALAGALVMRPEAILLDEATSMLDEESRIKFMSVIEQENKNGTTIIQITHRLDEIRHADRALVIDGGKIIIDEPPEKLLRRPNGELKKYNLKKPELDKFFSMVDNPEYERLIQWLSV